ncbi:hypothetical protein CSB45_04600 [candidate division KSB3 bacterium]|uniref:DUF4384 domain-containing protein n=1 Tax=candidate division KSB3 bacterium TaxID=2044937 RepID=A0A2G6E914_9BACT|nr:MAG: hypothetical protein CSB45_04600 [candidate division KSB3 bacterium]PIE30656.1 MAG: hypothetical protein CSA57_03185 [candidate division KSB3 bacterium]
MRYMSRFLLLLVGMLGMSFALGTPDAAAQQRPERPKAVVPSPIVGPPNGNRGLEINVWTDKGNQSPTYYVGERIYISFTVTKDSYVVLYDIDSTGNVNILFPNPYHPDNLVRKGRVYRFPAANYQHDLIVRGPTGEEIFFAVASSYAYYHWKFGASPPPIWSDEWGTSSTWGHQGAGPDYSIASRRFQQRLQFSQNGNLAEHAVQYIKHYSDNVVKAYPVTYAKCKFYVTVSPY